MLARLSSYAPLPLRLMLGVGFLYHGLPKLTAAGHQGFVGMLQGIGVPAPGLAAWLVGGVEVAGGAALLLGVLIAPAAALLSLNMIVAAVTVHLPNGFNFMNMTGMTDAGPTWGPPGYEVPLLYLAGLVSLLLSGPGAAAVMRKPGVKA